VARAIVRGISVSTGFAIGKAVFVNRRHHAEVPRQSIAPVQLDAEEARLRKAFTDVENDLASARDRIARDRIPRNWPSTATSLSRI